ncbi:elongator complex protein 5 isoform X1 [Quercus robur]|uniref:elongator complex protein 5 isoform X1 n=1 Tax=Quercus robur TaxID=38942 RepID=UPI0021622033|nr:elongator complex protein 5 isoform X1 [Quercus robur]XP_050269767.1 elongator complex protein 5 isoform X1 [Quercus robur]XP_050269768.1 elongator complex protein 5 isoform X1 [Quercus robur]XP_050269769.1 elongator complex protein 5 isoform X1 [Quercus robur]
MAESICRALRDGALQGEHAPALTIKDSIASPFGFHVFTHLLTQLSSNILAAKSQSRGLVLVALSRSPSFYLDLLNRIGIDVASSQKWIEILDCYTDPLGWKDALLASGNGGSLSNEASTGASLCRNVKDMDKLYSSIIELGKGIVEQGKVRFCVAIDSVNEILRHASISSVAGLLSNLRSNDRVSSIFWLSHSDLHEDRVTAVLEYMSSMVASIEPLNQSANGHRCNWESLPLLERNYWKGKFHVRFKRRNGRVRVMSEEFHVEQSAINFRSISSEDEIVNRSLLPKMQFNLQLSEKEQIDRAKVVLPFEHQGTGKPIQIYDVWRSLTDGKSEAEPVSSGILQANENSSKGKIIYLRGDSDDERPDSDEDPDDDLDI